jgi:hypothetical protein
MAAGRKKGYCDVECERLREIIYTAYDDLWRAELESDPIRARHLPRAYFVEKLYNMHITPWSQRNILRLLIYRIKYERKRG